MADRMHLPAGWATVTLRFSGVYVPLGAAITFQTENTGDLSAASIAASVVTAYWDNMRSNVTDGVRLDDVYARRGANSGVGPSAIVAVGTAGTIATPGMSPAVSFLIRKTTGLGGRRGRGRLYQPGVAEADVDGAGVVAAARVTAINADLASAFTALDGFGLQPAIAHRYPEVWPGPFDAPTLITSWACDARVATQRRRQRK